MISPRHTRSFAQTARLLSGIALCLAAPVDCVCAAEDALADFVKIVRARSTSSPAELVKMCEAFLERHPASVASDDVSFHLGRALVDQELFEKSIPHFNAVIARNADAGLVTDAVMQRAEAYRNTGRNRECLPDFEQAAEAYHASTNPEAAHALFHIVQVSGYLNDAAKAEEALARLKAEHPRSSHTQNAIKLRSSLQPQTFQERLPRGGLRIQDVELTQAAGDGQKARLAGFRGKVLVVVFWASWCDLHEESLAALQTLKDAHPAWEGRVEILTVNLDKTAEEARVCVAGKGWHRTVNMWAGEGGLKSAAAVAFGVRGIPAVFVLSADGRLVAAGHPGAFDTEGVVDKHLAEQSK